MQKTNFPFVAIVHDDASSDGTAKIVQEYAKKYPNLIKPLFEKENKYSKQDGSLEKIIHEATVLLDPKYLALCEGDDYWNDPQKLQKQVDFLDANIDFSICYHDVKLLFENTGEMSDRLDVRDISEVSTIYDLAEGNYIHTPSVMYRYSPQYYEKKSKIGPTYVEDYVSHMLYAENGKIFRMKDAMAVYRIHKDGIWGMTSPEITVPIWIKMLIRMLPHFSKDIQQVLLSQIDTAVTEVMEYACKMGERRCKSSYTFKVGNIVLWPIKKLSILFQERTSLKNNMVAKK